FNQPTTGVLETPFTLDRWTFAARANEQVMFDWINASAPAIHFQLTGPGGFSGFSGLTGDSGPVTLPADGTYVLEASALGGPPPLAIICSCPLPRLALGTSCSTARRFPHPAPSPLPPRPPAFSFPP